MNGFSALDPKTDPNIAQPQTIFIKGEKSPYIQDEDSLEIHRYFPGAQIVSIPNANHWVHAEQHDLFVKTVKYFLEE
jgi:pimeloyl-ACP methyl ester carboxylesterase